MTTEKKSNICQACGHEHTGRNLAYICIGCPCPETPGRTDDEPRMTTFKLRYQQRGAHMHVDVFMGPTGGTLALSGRLVMDPEQLKLLASTLEYGAVNTEDVELEWDEP